MKLRVLSLLVPALLIAGTASAAEIYNKDGNILDLNGKIDAEHYFSSNDGVDGDQSYLRFGFDGQTKISDQLTGYGQWEYQAALNTAEEQGTANSYTRVGFAGLKFGNWGSLDYGRNYGVMYDIGSWTDVLPEFGGDTYTADNFMEQRANGLLTYRDNDFFGLIKGLNIALQYQGKNDNPGGESSGRSAQAANGDGYGISATYDLGMGISAAAAYSSSDRTSDQNELAYGRGDKATAASGGLKYDANNVYLAAMYTHTENLTRIGSEDNDIDGFANKADNFEAVAQYQFDSGLRPSLAYLQSRGKDMGNFGTQDIEKYIDIGTYYYFNKNMSTFVDYKVNLLHDNDFTEAAGINTDNIVAVGLVYQF
ncbi:porin OmpC [Rouxiella badensis]|jgi:outer membrane pore protein C|uniref:Porin OmpC n=1 Tax=Rouxiella badensis TaxID=1646377 RepID=A0A1X0WDG5_9GAMM|nr:porin OmpC [Rouxiella badensis]MCC3720673.1 porin OmpC [Rouxiella badensis]MCC3730457.1 porin OmpC [Rouxiella badensis]MCC3734668.1 porin OmpC [Rouxiella badensis]MCC3741810.1 porin OmpC [Rouxiella badensis]MCC3747755.1 porin OmpC [Rouxiella badensis]